MLFSNFQWKKISKTSDILFRSILYDYIINLNIKASKIYQGESQTIRELLFTLEWKKHDVKEIIWCDNSMFRNDYNIVQCKKVGKEIQIMSRNVRKITLSWKNVNLTKFEGGNFMFFLWNLSSLFLDWSLKYI